MCRAEGPHLFAGTDIQMSLNLNLGMAIAPWNVIAALRSDEEEKKRQESRKRDAVHYGLENGPRLRGRSLPRSSK
jgi:hypothetical protein